MSARLRINTGAIDYRYLDHRVIEVDGRAAGIITGQVTEVEVSRGRHVVQLRHGWYRSVPQRFALGEGQVVEMTVVHHEPGLDGLVVGGWFALEIGPVTAQDASGPSETLADAGDLPAASPSTAAGPSVADPDEGASLTA